MPQNGDPPASLPRPEFKRLISVDEGTRNARRNLRKGYIEFHKLPEYNKRKFGPIAIVGGGPSLRERVAELASFRTVMACASAHDFLVENKIYPRYALVLDPLGGANLNYFGWRQDTCTYLVASHVTPEVLDHFRGYPVALWHAMGEIKKNIRAPQVMGGITAILRAQFVALDLGFTDHHYFGVDSCFSEAGDSHAYAITDPVNEPLSLPVQITVAGGRTFTSTQMWVEQARQFFAGVAATEGAFHSTLHGDGLIAEMLKCGNPKYLEVMTLT